MRVAFGGEVMTVTDDLELQRLLREAHDEAAAVAGLEDSLERRIERSGSSVYRSRIRSFSVSRRSPEA